MLSYHHCLLNSVKARYTPKQLDTALPGLLLPKRLLCLTLSTSFDLI